MPMQLSVTKGESVAGGGRLRVRGECGGGVKRIPLGHSFHLSFINRSGAGTVHQARGWALERGNRNVKTLWRSCGGEGRMTVCKKRLTLVLTEVPLPQLLKQHRKPSEQLKTTKFL